MENDYLDRKLSRRGFIAKAASFTLAVAASRVLAQGATTTASKTAKWNDAMELAVNLEIPTQMGMRAARPYVAVWVEDAKGTPVRTLAVWAQTSGRGMQYVRELRQWLQDEGTSNATSLLETVSAPTRPPGQYSLVWDGRDDKKSPVTQGEYTVIVEAAREHGTYQVMRQKVTIASKPFSIEVPGNTEIKSVTVEYRAKK